ncbi:MAG: acetyl-CoA carboxylase biotin carboxylase subunit [Clostridiales bacterium]|jgi:acetyl-CoA carboxylase biotin carboxylase subunit|nr:acetyl-CoA carboxylase biotin carboxylase subunit [Clostridiales bacterium]
MFRKILIANRGEIAVRIIRTCKELGIETVAIYSKADEAALHVKYADEAVCVGPAKSSESYLNMKNILAAATTLGCDAIHPGFGFLSENATFARLVETCGIKFIGPSGDVIDCMGNKSAARKLMMENGVPVVPGSNGSVHTLEEARKAAEAIGYPVLIKASAGGGGRGMRKVFSAEDFEKEFLAAKSEAKSCFGDDDMYLEKLILNPKHIEFQIIADSFGNVVHLGERDCSIQRRNQKMIEEAPSTALTPELRERMGQDAVRAARAAGYENAGTIEYVLDKEGNYYFIEMNTRIQVEHPVTEMITGIDLIKEQITIAEGRPLSFHQEDVTLRGHAIECRINAENPKENFRPCPGMVKAINLPGGLGVRVDTALYQGYPIPSCYDSMVAKVIAYGNTRDEVIHRMRRVLEELIIQGVDTNVDLHYMILYTKEFMSGDFDTSFIENNLEKLVK